MLKQAALGGISEGPEKPENIALHIGRRPLLAVGNSDGDLEMLEYTTGRQRLVGWTARSRWPRISACV